MNLSFLDDFANCIEEWNPTFLSVSNFFKLCIFLGGETITKTFSCSISAQCFLAKHCVKNLLHIYEIYQSNCNEMRNRYKLSSSSFSKQEKKLKTSDFRSEKIKKNKVGTNLMQLNELSH